MARTAKTNVKKKDEPKPVHICGGLRLGRVLLYSFKFGY